MGRLGVIIGSGLHDAELAEGDWLAVRRHAEAGEYELPHRIDYVAIMRGLRDAGCDRVLGLSSVGGLRAELGPGTLLVPDDFIALDAEPVTALDGPAAHRVPAFDREWRKLLLNALETTGANAVAGGVYWQTRGPRLDTAAEIRFVAAHADVIGMTVASECIVAGELGLRYAALCVVDNLANGIGTADLSLGEIDINREINREALLKTLAALLPRLV